MNITNATSAVPSNILSDPSRVHVHPLPDSRAPNTNVFPTPVDVPRGASVHAPAFRTALVNSTPSFPQQHRPSFEFNSGRSKNNPGNADPPKDPYCRSPQLLENQSIGTVHWREAQQLADPMRTSEPPQMSPSSSLSPFVQAGHSLGEQYAQQEPSSSDQDLLLALNEQGEEEETEEEELPTSPKRHIPKAKRIQKIPLKRKLEIVTCWEARSVKSRAALSKKFGVSKTTAHRIIENKEILKKLASREG
ncbi:MAG: hypothetical protein J3Q66DRAFT_391577 [Benniella sp.]|nr:MAG: hypothetical protein J3Q66DRAFT_391577 [Benniella sp.]